MAHTAPIPMQPGSTIPVPPYKVYRTMGQPTVYETTRGWCYEDGSLCTEQSRPLSAHLPADAALRFLAFIEGKTQDAPKSKSSTRRGPYRIGNKFVSKKEFEAAHATAGAA